MVHEAAPLTRLSRLRVDLAVDVSALISREEEARQLLERLGAGETLSRPEVVLLAVNLHGYYTALETALERIARLMDEEVPAGPAWHQELVEQMRVAVPGLRPAVVPVDTVPELHELRRFRHFFRNAYVLELDLEKVRAQANRLVTVHPSLQLSLEAFQRHLDDVVDALAQRD